VDLFVREYPGQHFLEWNWQNAGHGESCGYDFDGILCRDFTPEECRTEASYRSAMATISPLYLPRRRRVPLIVTARHVAYEPETRAWLDRHGVAVDRLVMRDRGGPGDHGHDPDAVARWKARHYREGRCTLFAESDPVQAEIIARESGKSVLCPAAGRAIPGTALERAKACPDRGCKTGCAHAICRRFHREVHLTNDCVPCIESR
jgi:hypothetical protein